MSKNQGKIFEQDFQQSAQKVMSFVRLNDPGSSFNIKCAGCPKQVTRFAPKHMCDAIAYKHPYKYNLELKSSGKKSIPFKDIVRGPKDNRIEKMVLDAEIPGVYSFVIFNFRAVDNLTMAVHADDVLSFIELPYLSGFPGRKSIPVEWVQNYGITIPSYKKKVRYSYLLDSLFTKQKNYWR